MRFCFRTYEFDEEKRELLQAGHLVPLEPKFYQLLWYLLTHRAPKQSCLNRVGQIGAPGVIAVMPCWA